MAVAENPDLLIVALLPGIAQQGPTPLLRLPGSDIIRPTHNRPARCPDPIGLCLDSHAVLLRDGA
jgi:hypothetical protein